MILIVIVSTFSLRKLRDQTDYAFLVEEVDMRPGLPVAKSQLTAGPLGAPAKIKKRVVEVVFERPKKSCKKIDVTSKD